MAVPTLPPWMFNLDGTFLGFAGVSPARARSIHLEVEGEVLTIKLRKDLRDDILRSQLQPGDYLHCIGRTEFDGHTIQLNAYQVFTPRSKASSPSPPPRNRHRDAVRPAAARSPRAFGG